MAIINVTPLTDITDLIASDNVTEGDVLLLEEGIYFQTVNVTKGFIRIVAKGPEVIFDGKNILLTAFTLANVSGVAIEGINIMQYRVNGVLIQGGSGNRIINNKINNTLGNAIDVRQSSGNLIWKNEIRKCLDGVRLIQGSTNNWVIENLARECFDDGFESFLEDDINNAFISNTAIKNRANGLDMFGSNNLLLDNLLIDNGFGIIISQGSNSVAIGNIVKGNKSDTHFIANGYMNYFASENRIVCNRRIGTENQSQFAFLLNNEISFNGGNGIVLGEPSLGNLLMNNELICNIPENIVDLGTNNNLIDNIDKPCRPCESPSDVCGNCPHKGNTSFERLRKVLNDGCEK